MISNATLTAAMENATAGDYFAKANDAAKVAAAAEAYPALAFEVGTTYYTRSLGDHNCIISITVAKRTKCFITTTDGERFKVKKHYRENMEQISPWGTYSMSPLLYASSTKELKTDWDN